MHSVNMRRIGVLFLCGVFLLPIGSVNAAPAPSDIDVVCPEFESSKDSSATKNDDGSVTKTVKGGMTAAQQELKQLKIETNDEIKVNKDNTVTITSQCGVKGKPGKVKFCLPDGRVCVEVTKSEDVRKDLQAKLNGEIAELTEDSISKTIEDLKAGVAKCDSYIALICSRKSFTSNLPKEFQDLINGAGIASEDFANALADSSKSGKVGDMLQSLVSGDIDGAKKIANQIGLGFKATDEQLRALGQQAIGLFPKDVQIQISSVNEAVAGLLCDGSSCALSETVTGSVTGLADKAANFVGGGFGLVSGNPTLGGNSSRAAELSNLYGWGSIDAKYGLEQNTLSLLSISENGGKLSGCASTSSACGPFQWTKNSWSDWTQKLYGQALPMELRSDPRIAGELTAYRASLAVNQYGSLAQQAGINQATLVKINHFLGEGDTTPFLRAYIANPNTIAASVVQPASVSANTSVFYKKSFGGSVPRTVAELTAYFAKTMDGSGASGNIFTNVSGSPFANSSPLPKVVTGVLNGVFGGGTGFQSGTGGLLNSVLSSVGLRGGTSQSGSSNKSSSNNSSQSNSNTPLPPDSPSSQSGGSLGGVVEPAVTLITEPLSEVEKGKTVIVIWAAAGVSDINQCKVFVESTAGRAQIGSGNGGTISIEIPKDASITEVVFHLVCVPTDTRADDSDAVKSIIIDII